MSYAHRRSSKMNHSNSYSFGRLLRHVRARFGLRLQTVPHTVCSTASLALLHSLVVRVHSSHSSQKNSYGLWGRLGRCESGATLIEFLITFPILMILLLGILEFTALQVARIKVDKSSYTIASILTQLNRAEQSPAGEPSYFTVDAAQVDAVLERLDRMVPSATRVGTKVVVSGFTYADRMFTSASGAPQPVNGPLLLWAKGRVFGANPENSASTATVLGANVSWPSSVQMQRITFADVQTQQALATYGTFRCGENVVMVEVFYDYEPIFGLLPDLQFITRRTLVSRSFLRPRTGDIEAIAGDATFGSPAASYQTTKSRGGFCS